MTRNIEKCTRLDMVYGKLYDCSTISLKARIMSTTHFGLVFRSSRYLIG